MALFVDKILAGRIKTEHNVTTIRIRTNINPVIVTVTKITDQSYENSTINETSFYVIDSDKSIKQIKVDTLTQALEEFMHNLDINDNLFDFDDTNDEEEEYAGGGAAAAAPIPTSPTSPTSPPPTVAPALSSHLIDDHEEDASYNPDTDVWLTSFGGDDIRTKYYRHISIVVYMCVIGAVSTIL
jgi:hypothetical protein